MISCLEARRLAPRFVSLELDAATEREVREHLSGCAPCREAVVGSDPALALAWAAAAAQEPADDERFVGEVMAQIHQRRLERRLVRSRARLLAAAAVLVAVLGGALAVRQLAVPSGDGVARVTAPAAPARAAAPDPAFVEVDGSGAWLYQMTPASDSRDAVQVAFIVDPHLEL